MTEEDQYGYVMPERYRCDSCRAVMFHLNKSLHDKQPKSRRLKQWEYVDVLEDTCRGGFEGYGIKLIDGENALSGPGLPRDEALAPGSGAIQMSSENWSKRLGEICRKLVFETIGEEETYDIFYQRYKAGAEELGDEPGLSEALCRKELRQCVVGPRTPKPSSEGDGDGTVEPKKAKKEKKEKRDSKKDGQNAGEGKSRAAKDAKSSDGMIDVETFLKNLAVKHGQSSDKYVSRRSAAEWEKLTVSLAGKIFSKTEL